MRSKCCKFPQHTWCLQNPIPSPTLCNDSISANHAAPLLQRHQLGTRLSPEEGPCRPLVRRYQSSASRVHLRRNAYSVVCGPGSILSGMFRFQYDPASARNAPVRYYRFRRRPCGFVMSSLDDPVCFNLRWSHTIRCVI